MEISILNIFQFSAGFFLLFAVVLNLIKSKINNRLLAYFLLIVLHGNLYDIFNPKHLPSLYFDVTGLFFSSIYYGPVLYLYFLSLSKRKIHSKTISKHLGLPFVLLVLKFIDQSLKGETVKGFTGILFLLISSFLLVYYLIKGFKIVKKYKLTHNLNFKFRFRLFYYTVNGYFILLFLSLVFFGIYTVLNNFENSVASAQKIYHFIFFPFCFILCFYGITEATWLKSLFIFNPVEKIKNEKDELLLFEIIKKNIETEKDYLNPNINLDLFSRNLALTPISVTNSIKSNGYKNFNSFINEYRIRCFKSKLNSLEYKSYTLPGIAFDCGFKSKTTFFRVFKEKEGMTPNQYIKSL